jgi:excisionase family DNA binding protein
MTDPKQVSVVVVSPDELRALIANAVAEALAGTGVPAMPTTWLTTQEVADLVGVSRATLDGLRARGEGPPYRKIGRAVRYRREDIERGIHVDSTPEEPRQGRVSPPIRAVSRTIPSQRTSWPTRATKAPASAPKDQYVTAKEASKILGLPAHTLSRLSQEIPYVMIGRMIRYRRADLLNAESGAEPWHVALKEARLRAIPKLAPEVTKDYLNDREAAALLGVHTGILQALRSQDRGPPYLKLGYLVRYRRADLDESGSAAPPPPPEDTPGVRFCPGNEGWQQVIAKARQGWNERQPEYEARRKELLRRYKATGSV